MKVVFATDHAGFDLKNHLVEYVKGLGHEVEDFGAHELNDQDDYPDFIALAAKAVSENPKEILGVILGGSGEGEAMVANRHANVRAVVYYGGDEQIITLSKEHNNSNVLSLGARFLNKDKAEKVVKLWLETEFGGEERHQRRIEKIERHS